MAKQFVVQLKNEPGAMATLAEALAARGVDLRAIGGGSMGDSGHVIMTTADDETAKAILDEGGYTYIEGESILTVGRAIHFERDGCRLVVNCAPFSCMHGNITTALFEQLRGHMTIPVVNVFYDGSSDNAELATFIRQASAG